MDFSDCSNGVSLCSKQQSCCFSYNFDSSFIDGALVTTTSWYGIFRLIFDVVLLDFISLHQEESKRGQTRFAKAMVHSGAHISNIILIKSYSQWFLVCLLYWVRKYSPCVARCNSFLFSVSYAHFDTHFEIPCDFLFKSFSRHWSFESSSVFFL